MSKIIATIPTLGIEVTSEKRWINNERTRLVDMTEEHLRNAVLWAYRKWQDELGAKLTAEVKLGHTYREWYLILKAVYDRPKLEVKQEPERSVRSNSHNGSRSNNIRDCYGTTHADIAFESFLNYSGY